MQWTPTHGVGGITFTHSSESVNATPMNGAGWPVPSTLTFPNTTSVVFATRDNGIAFIIKGTAKDFIRVSF